MNVKLCKNCGYQLYRRSSKCPRCGTPVKKITALHYFILILMISPVLLLIAGLLTQYDFTSLLTPQEPIQSEVVKKIRVQPPVNLSKENGTQIYVKGAVANIRQDPSIQSPTIWKFKKGQQLTQVDRSGNWVQILADDIGNKRGWIHASLIGTLKPDQPQKAENPHQAFNDYLKFFERFNTEIKMIKGTTFFENVEFLGNGVIQVTATQIFLSGPEIYKKKYVAKIVNKWWDLRGPGLRAAVKIVDTEGILRMEKKRG